MDNSETYVKMCEKAEEIQLIDTEGMDIVERFTEPWECDCGKYKGEQYRGIICDKCGEQVGIPIWLPRQDQLQEMISQDWKKVLAILYAYAKNYDFTQCETMEQFTEAVLMKEKYDKVWNGTDWIKAVGNAG
jgi:hypothetical protein